MNKKIKRTRANGMGSVVFHKGRTKPYEVRVTAGYEINEETGREKRINKSLGYYKLKIEAERVLMVYNSTKIENERTGNVSRFKETITFSELYESWSNIKFKKKIAKSTLLAYQAAYKAVPILYDKVFVTIQTEDLRNALYSSGKNYPTMRKIRLLFSQLYNYAIENRLTNFDASSFLKFDQNEKEELNPNRIDRNAFSFEEIKMIFEDTVNEDFTDTVKFLLFTGVRVGEMMDLKKEDVYLDENYFIVRESKTEAGRNRPVPIHPFIKPIVEKWMCKKSVCDTLFTNKKGTKFIDSVYRRNYWDNYFNLMGMKYHWPHDCRHTFKTFCSECGIRENLVERILGHKCQNNMAQHYDRPFIKMLHQNILKLNFDFQPEQELFDYNML